MKFDICHAINFAEKGVAHHVPVLFVGTLNECLARKVKFHQSSMWEGCQLQLALPMLHGHVMNIIHMYVYIFFYVYAVYIYSAAKVPATSGSFPSKGRPWQAKNIGPKWWRSGRAMNVFNSSTHKHPFLYEHAVTNSVTSHSSTLSLWVPLALPRKLLSRGIAFRSRPLRPTGKRNCHGPGVMKVWSLLMLQIVHGYMLKAL